MSIIAKRVKKGIFFDKVQFEANILEKASFETFFGTKIFYLDKNDTVTLSVSKDKMWEPGDKAKSLAALITSGNQTKFPWYWKY